MISNVKQAKINLFFDRPYFYLGEFIRGTIEINTNSKFSLSGILIEIILSENWRIDDNSGDNSQIMNDSKTIVTYNLDLKSLEQYKIDNKIFLLPAGITFVPFNFRFSEEHNPSFEYPLPGKRASLRYNFSVKLKSPYLSGNSSYFLCLISRPIIQSEKLLTKTINQHIKKWKLFDKGFTQLKLTIPENNYKYDSICKVNIEIDNTNGKETTKEYKIRLIRKVKYKNKLGEIKHIDETEISSERVKAVVEPGKKGVFEHNLVLKENDTNKRFNYIMQTNPYNIKMDKVNFFMPTINGNIISCDYGIKISLYFNCFVAYDDRPRLILPIYLVHQLPYDYQLEIQEQIDYENALQKSMFEKDNKSHKEKINFKDNNNYKDKEEINYKIENNYLEKNNIIIENNEEDNSLPSLEAIEEANKYKNKNNNIIIENKNNINIDINLNKNNYDDNCPPSLLESAPVPPGFEEPPINYGKNNAYPIYNQDNFNENRNDNYNKNIIDINQIDDDDNNKNQMVNNYNVTKNGSEDFSLFDLDNNSNYK